MKKSTKKMIAALVIILLFGMSTIAYVVASLQGMTAQTNQQKPLEGHVVDQVIDPELENTYIQNQYTFLRFNYVEKDALYYYVEQLPETMALPTGQVQLIVNRVQANGTKIEIANLNGVTEITDITDSGIYNALCENLLYTPTDCLLANINFPVSSENITNSTNSTINTTNENTANPDNTNYTNLTQGNLTNASA